MFVFLVEYSVNFQLETVAVGLKLLEYWILSLKKFF